MRTVSRNDLVPKSAQLKKPGTAAPRPQEVKVEVKQAEAVAPVINIDMGNFAADNTAALKMLADALKAQQTTEKNEPREWVFEVQRDSNNLIKTITAKAKG